MMIMSDAFDLIILGGGSAGFAAANRANEDGLKAALINSGYLGGTCVNIGCVPTKFLLNVGDFLHRARNPVFDGVSIGDIKLDFKRVMAEKKRIVEKLRESNYRNVLTYMPNVTLFEGRGRLLGDNRVQVGSETLEGKKTLIAIGSRPVHPPFKGIDEVGFLTSDELIEAEELPGSLIVVGGRAVGLEFAQIFSRFGSDVTLLQRSERILPDHEREASEELARSLRAEGIAIHTGVSVDEVYQEGDLKGVNCTIDGSKRVFEADEILMATGRRPDFEGLGLEEAGVETVEGFVNVDGHLRTSNPDIYAAGDCVSRVQLETLAARMGSYAVRNAFEGADLTIDVREFPRAVFTDPQVALVGYTEEEYHAETGVCACRSVSMEYVPKAQILKDTRGMIKMGINPSTRQVVGVNIVAYNASELIHEGVLAYKFGLTIDDIIQTPHVFPTMMEGLKKVSHSFYRDISVMSCCIE
jgi:mercuric reductase